MDPVELRINPLASNSFKSVRLQAHSEERFIAPTPVEE
jgi:hypothetical protein